MKDSLEFCKEKNPAINGSAGFGDSGPDKTTQSFTCAGAARLYQKEN